jgi:4-hydroxybenzoate polyprenyltransferase
VGQDFQEVLDLNLKEAFKLMRPQQWFKSLSILFGASVVIYLQGYNINTIINIILAFFSVSFLSSSVYVFNDIADVKKDRLHPVKKNRPIAKGTINIREGIILGLILIIVSFLILYFLNPNLILVGLGMILNTFLYSFKPFRFKYVPVLDVISAGLNFSLRVLIGWYSISNLIIYRTIILWPFFIAGFLLSCKRLAEYKFLEHDAGSVRKVFNYYNIRTLRISINVYLTLSILAYYFFANIFNPLLFLIGPWFFIQMYWYKSFTNDKKSVVKRPEDVFMKKKLFSISGLLFCLTWLGIVLLT